MWLIYIRARVRAIQSNLHIQHNQLNNPSVPPSSQGMERAGGRLETGIQVGHFVNKGDVIHPLLTDCSLLIIILRTVRDRSLQVVTCTMTKTCSFRQWFEVVMFSDSTMIDDESLIDTSRFPRLCNVWTGNQVGTNTWKKYPATITNTCLSNLSKWNTKYCY